MLFALCAAFAYCLVCLLLRTGSCHLAKRQLYISFWTRIAAIEAENASQLSLLCNETKLRFVSKPHDATDTTFRLFVQNFSKRASERLMVADRIRGEVLPALEEAHKDLERDANECRESLKLLGAGMRNLEEVISQREAALTAVMTAVEDSRQALIKETSDAKRKKKIEAAKKAAADLRDVRADFNAMVPTFNISVAAYYEDEVPAAYNQIESTAIGNMLELRAIHTHLAEILYPGTEPAAVAFKQNVARVDVNAAMIDFVGSVVVPPVPRIALREPVVTAEERLEAFTKAFLDFFSVSLNQEKRERRKRRLARRVRRLIDSHAARGEQLSEERATAILAERDAALVYGLVAVNELLTAPHAAGAGALVVPPSDPAAAYASTEPDGEFRVQKQFASDVLAPGALSAQQAKSQVARKLSSLLNKPFDYDAIAAPVGPASGDSTDVSPVVSRQPSGSAVGLGAAVAAAAVATGTSIAAAPAPPPKPVKPAVRAPSPSSSASSSSGSDSVQLSTPSEAVVARKAKKGFVLPSGIVVPSMDSNMSTGASSTTTGTTSSSSSSDLNSSAPAIRVTVSDSDSTPPVAKH